VLPAQFDLDIGEEEMPDSAQPRMREMTFNLATGEATSRQLADVICDFPRVPEHLTGVQTLPCPLTEGPSIAGLSTCMLPTFAPPFLPFGRFRSGHPGTWCNGLPDMHA
jgi:hypothetical protein